MTMLELVCQCAFHWCQHFFEKSVFRAATCSIVCVIITTSNLHVDIEDYFCGQIYLPVFNKNKYEDVEYVLSLGLLLNLQRTCT
jgi:hypothetical protein